MQSEERITTQDIEALVDGQLEPARAARVHAQLNMQPYLNRHYQQLMAQKQLLLQWWAHLPQTEGRKSST